MLSQLEGLSELPGGSPHEAITDAKITVLPRLLKRAMDHIKTESSVSLLSCFLYLQLLAHAP